MASIAQLVLADGQASPVNHTFVPQTSQVGVEPAQWLDKITGTPFTYGRITVSVDPGRGTTSNKVKVVIAVPKPTVVGAGCCVDQNTPQVSYTTFANVTFSLPQGSTLQDRKDILAFTKNLLAHAVMTSAVVDLEPVW